MFGNIRDDWNTHGRSWARHGFWVLLIYRFGRWRYTIRPRAIRLPFSFFYEILKFFSAMFFGVDFPCEATIGRGFVFEHIGDIVISGDASFGDDCVMRNGVTVGLRRRGVRGSPQIGNRVDIGAGAKLLGPIHIGDDCAIGANAVVLCDVPPNCIAVGIPARILPRSQPAEPRLSSEIEEAVPVDAR